MDYSDVFLLVPMVPPRSVKRSETPSPLVEWGGRQWAASQLIQSASPGLARDGLQDPEKNPSRHVSALPALRQPLVQFRQPPPSAHPSAVASAIVRAFSPTLKGQPEPQRQAVKPTPVQQPASNSSIRAAIDSSMKDLSRSYAQPSMSLLPQNVPTINMDQERSPALFSYKGAIPAADGLASNASMAPSWALGARSPPLLAFPRQALTGGRPTSSPFAPMNSAQFSSAGGLIARGTLPRQFSTGVLGPRQIPNFQHKSSSNAPLRRSPLSSHAITPPESDRGSNAGDKNIGVATGKHSRQPSLRNMPSMQSALTKGKPRTYFTHRGRVVVADGESPPSQTAAITAKTEMPKEATPLVSGASTVGGKKKSQ
ncbi:hypothetical protein LTR17_015744 [Elasticomyces elasticus]|nr:hypothetical protein LTR17_015744 [Elasticomyces elasticus]